MIIVAGSLFVGAAERGAYLEGCSAVVRAAREAEGCLDYALSADLLDPTRVNVYERWESGEALLRFRRAGPDAGQLAVLREIRVDDYEVTPAR